MPNGDKYKSVDQLPDISSKVKSVDDLPDLNEKKNGIQSQPSSSAATPASVSSGATGTQLPQQSGSTNKQFDSNYNPVQAEQQREQNINSQSEHGAQSYNTPAPATVQQGTSPANSPLNISKNYQTHAQQKQALTDQAIINTASAKMKIEGLDPTDPKNKQQLNFQKEYFKEQVSNGDATLSLDAKGNPGLKKVVGTEEALTTAYDKSKTESQDADMFVNNMNSQQKIDYLKQQQNNNPNPEYVGEDKGGTGAILGNLIGGNVNFLGKATAGTATGAALIYASPETLGQSLTGLPTALSFAFTAPDAVNQGAKNEITRRYYQLKHDNPKMSDIDAMNQAESGKWSGGAAGLATNALLMGDAPAENLLEKPLTDESKSVVLKTIGDGVKSGIKMGAISAGVTAGKELEGKAEGVNTSIDQIAQDAGKDFIQNATVGAILHTFTSAIMGVVKAPLSSSAIPAMKYALVNSAPLSDIKSTLSLNEKAGNIPQGSADAITNDLKQYKDAIDKIPEEVTPDKKAQIASLLQEKQNISDKSEGKEKVLTDAVYKPQLEAIDNKINNIIAQPSPTPDITPASNIQPTETFRTLNYGDHTGEPESKLKQDEIKQDIINDNPIGNTGEKFSDFVKRVAPAFKNVLDNEDNNTTLVTHSSVIKALDVWNDMGRPDVDKMDESQMKDFANNYTKEDIAKEGDLTTFKSDNGNEIHVARHGETEDNKMSEFRSNDTQLTDKGEKQAAQAGQELNKLTNGDVPKIITSDLPRTIRTSNIISDQLAKNENITESNPENKQGDEQTEDSGKPKSTTDETTQTISRQEKVNNIIDDVRRYNEMRRNSPDKPSLENDIKLRAQELGLTIKKNGDVMSALNDSGNNIKKANIEKNSTTAKDFNKENYLPETQDFIDNKLTNDNWQNLPPVKGYDGKTLSLGQMEAAVKELKEGNVTNAGKAIYDAVDNVFKDDNADYSDKRLNFIHNEKMSSGDFVKQFNKPVNEATDEDIKSLHELMGDEAFEKYFNELKNQEDEFNKESYPANPASEAGRTQNSDNPIELNGQRSAKEDKASDVSETATTPEPVVEKPTGNTGAERESTITESNVPGEVESNRRYNEKVEFARKNSYKYFKEEYPDITVDEYNQLRSSEPKETYKIDTNDHTIFPEENAPQMAGSGAMFPGVSPFISRDIAPQIPKAADAAKSWFKSVRNTIKSWYEPDSAKGLTKATLRPYLANIAELKDAAWHVVKARRRMWDKVPDEVKYKFIDAIETGKYSQKDFQALGFNENNSKMFSGVAKEYRERLDAMHMLEKTYKEQAQYIDNYFPHIWEKPETAQEFFSNYTSKMSKQGFEKTRTIDLIKAGLDKGLKLKTTNPEEIVLMREFGGYQRKNMVDFMDKMKEQGLVRLAFPDTETGKFTVPDGFKKLKDDPFNKMKIFFDQKNGIPVFAAGAEKVIENYLSPSIYTKEGLVGNLFRGNMAVKNFMTSIRLLSGYHLVSTTFSDMATQINLALRNAQRGDFGKFAVNLLKTPVSPFMDFSGQFGDNDIMKAWDNGAKTPEMQTAIDLIKRGGGRAHLSEIWQQGLKDKWNNAIDEYKQSNFIGGSLRLVPAAMEGAQKLVLEGYVSRLKLASYLKLANDYMANTGETDEVKQNQALGKIWDSQDNRFGQLVYDNLFWKRWVRDMGTASTLSLGWNLGTIREFGGAMKDLPDNIISSIKNKKLELSDRVLFAVAYPMIVGAAGGLMTQLLSGKPPKELKDYFYPCTKRNDDGTCAERIQMPSMMKEFFGLKNTLQAQGPIKGSATYVTNKLAPQFNNIAELLNNKDYYNTEIRNESDPAFEQAKEVAQYIGENGLAPMAYESVKQSGDTGAKMGLDIMGFTKAPSYISNTPMENRIINRYNELNQDLKPYSTKETKDISTKIKSLYASGDKSAMEAYIHKVVDEGKISPTSIRGILKSINKHQTVFQYLFGKLPKTDQYHMYKDMTDEEKKQFDPSGKVGRMAEKMDKQIENEDN